MKNLITILCLCLFWFSCESPTNPEPSEIDVDWMLVKTQSSQYLFFYTTLSDITNLNLQETSELDEFGNEIGCCLIITSDQTNDLSFVYNNENFSYDISDSFNQNTNPPSYLIESTIFESLSFSEQILTLTTLDGYQVTFDLSNQFIIDYR